MSDRYNNTTWCWNTAGSLISWHPFLDPECQAFQLPQFGHETHGFGDYLTVKPINLMLSRNF